MVGNCSSTTLWWQLLQHDSFNSITEAGGLPNNES